jgi:hypothetical protein
MNMVPSPFIDGIRTARAASHRPDSTMLRLIARALIVLVTVFGLSLAFAWAWDRSDAPKTAQQQGA